MRVATICLRLMKLQLVGSVKRNGSYMKQIFIYMFIKEVEEVDHVNIPYIFCKKTTNILSVKKIAKHSMTKFM